MLDKRCIMIYNYQRRCLGSFSYWRGGVLVLYSWFSLVSESSFRIIPDWPFSGTLIWDVLQVAHRFYAAWSKYFNYYFHTIQSFYYGFHIYFFTWSMVGRIYKKGDSSRSFWSLLQREEVKSWRRNKPNQKEWKGQGINGSRCWNRWALPVWHSMWIIGLLAPRILRPGLSERTARTWRTLFSAMPVNWSNCDLTA